MTPVPGPVVRTMIVCGDILVDPKDSKRVTLVNLIGTIKSSGEPRFPVRQEELCVFVELAECRESGDAFIAICQADTEEKIFTTRRRKIPAPSNVLESLGLRFRIKSCRFPAAGLYWVQFIYNDRLLSERPLLLR
jgi:hypothetical protein